METKSKKTWGFLAVNGIISILFGALLLFFTESVIKTLVIYFGIAILLGGLILLFTAIRNMKKNKKAGMLLVTSVAILVVGLILILFPKSSLGFFLIIIGVWAIIAGIVQLISLIHSWEGLAGKYLLLVNSLLTITLGVFLFFNPFTMAEILVKITGVLAILFGLLMIYFGFAVRSIKPVEEKQG